MFYILHGEEEFTRSEEVAKLRAQVMSQGMGDLNIARLDGRKLGLAELISICSTTPFLSDRRLIIVEDLLQRFEPLKRSHDEEEGAEPPAAGDKEYAKRLVAYLPQLPPFARLLFLERKTLSARNPVLQLAQKEKQGYIRLFERPDEGRLQDWVRQRARDKGVSITREAVQLLIALAGRDLRLLDAEMEKLAALANYSRPVTIEDVRALVTAWQESDIFALVDSLGLRNREQAMQQLHALLANQANELYLLTMVARQFRLLISIKDLAEERGLRGAPLKRELGVAHDFIVDKLLKQSQRFRLEELVGIQRRIVALDQEIKTGQIEGPLGLELLVLEICRRSESEERQPSREVARSTIRRSRLR
jgi:DNA polymerase-3 subunit delta